MRVISRGDKCPYCGNTTRKSLHKQGFFFIWIPIAKRYACKWCSGSYTSVMGWFTIGIR